MSGLSGQAGQLRPKGHTHELGLQPFGHLPLTGLTGLTELDIERNKTPFKLTGPLVRSGVGWSGPTWADRPACIFDIVFALRAGCLFCEMIPLTTPTP